MSPTTVFKDCRNRNKVFLSINPHTKLSNNDCYLTHIHNLN